MLMFYVDGKLAESGISNIAASSVHTHRTEGGQGRYEERAQ